MSARHRAPDGAAQPWTVPGAAARGAADGSAAAVRRVTARAYAEIRATRGVRDRDAVARVIDALAMPGTDSLLDPAVKSALGRVGVDDLRLDPAGERTIALLMLEYELTVWIEQGKVDLDAVADALTAYLVAWNRASAAIDGRARIVHAVREYLERRRLGHFDQSSTASVAVHQLPAQQRAAWDELAARIPWLHWLGHEAFTPRVRAEVSAAGLVDLLVLLRPCQRRKYGTDAVEAVPLPERFLRLYAVPGLDRAEGFTAFGAGGFAGPAESSEGPLARLALALDPLLHEPGRTARLVQSLTLPPALGEAVEARLTAELNHAEAPEHLLVIRVDNAASPRVLAVNLSPSYPLSLRVGGQSLRLQPNAVEQRGAAAYCSQPVPVRAGDQVEIGGRLLSLDVPMAELAESGNITSSTIPSELFRGREQQLAMLRHGLGGREPYTGRLIFGPRRAGKSTLMEQAALDERLRGKVSIDVGNTRAGVRDYAGWSREVSRELVRVVRRRLPGVTLEPGDDFIEIIQDLDDALAGGAPVALCLDEFDALLLPEQQAGGRRAAAKLGNMVFENLLVMGTVQRFHRSIHEFKNWRMVECPADLSWADGITYFLGPLSDAAPGPRVEWLTRPSVAPHLFAAQIAPMIGLRPYFWAQLRANLESVFRADLGQSRLVGPELVRQELTRMLTHDPYLRSVTESAAALGFLDPEELRRRDLLSAAEQAVLVLFARLPAGQDGVPAEAAVAAGGEDAIAELIDRAFLTWNAGMTRLRCAVPIFQDSLRAQVRQLEALTAQAVRPAPKLAPAKETPAVATKPAPAAQPEPAAKPEAKAKPAPAKPDVKPAQAAGEPAAAKAAPSREVLEAAATALATAAERAAPVTPQLPAGVTMADIRRVQDLVAAQLDAPGARLPASDLGSMIHRDVPSVIATKYAGRKRLTDFVDAFLPEYAHHDAGKPGAYLTRREPEASAVPSVPAPAAPAAAKAAPRPEDPATPAATPTAKTAATPTAKPAAGQPAANQPAASVSRADIQRVRAALLVKLTGGHMMTLHDASVVVTKAVPQFRLGGDWGGEKSFGQFLRTYLDDFRVENVNGMRMLLAPAQPAQPARGAKPAQPGSAAPVRNASTPAAKARKVGPPTTAEDAADIARVRAALLKRLAEQEVLYFVDAGKLMLEVAPRLRRSGTWAGEPSLMRFFEIHFKDFRIDGPSHNRYIRAAAQPSPEGLIKRLFNWR